MALKMLLFFTVCSCAAWPMLFVGIGTRRDVRRRSVREFTRTTGIIVDYVHSEKPAGKNGGSTLSKPVVEYTAEGQDYREAYWNHLTPEQFPVGATVEVLYDVSDPSRFHLEADPVFIYQGAGAIRFAIVWIAASAALTVALAVFVGGARFDFTRLWIRVQMLLRHRR